MVLWRKWKDANLAGFLVFVFPSWNCWLLFRVYCVLRQHLAQIDLFGTIIRTGASLCSIRRHRLDERGDFRKVNGRVIELLLLEAGLYAPAACSLLCLETFLQFSRCNWLHREGWTGLRHFRWISLQSCYCH